MSYTTIPQLSSTLPEKAIIIPYKDWVIVAKPTSKGIAIAIYEFIDDLDYYDGYDARIQVFQRSERDFEDQGRGIQWAFETLGE